MHSLFFIETCMDYDEIPMLRQRCISSCIEQENRFDTDPCLGWCRRSCYNDPRVRARLSK